MKIYRYCTYSGGHRNRAICITPKKYESNLNHFHITRLILIFVWEYTGCAVEDVAAIKKSISTFG